MSPWRAVIACAASVGLLALLAFASATPLRYHAADAASLRLSWSARPERIEVCRTLSDDELAKLAEHMRQRVLCDGVFATYVLRIDVDDQMIGESIVRGAGLRNDRPLYLLRDYPVPPGRHRVRVSLTRREKTDRAADDDKAEVPDVDTDRYAGRSEREASERSRRARAAIPASLVLDTTFSLIPKRVALVVYNADRRALELHAEAPPR